MSTLVVPADVFSSGSAVSGYTLLGQGTHNFIAESLDADGNIIVGAGAPLFNIGAATGSLSGVRTSSSTTTASAPNSFTITPPAALASGTASFTVTPTFTGQATSGCTLTGANCSPVTVTVGMQPVLYVVDRNTSAVTVYDQNGKELTLTHAFSGLSGPWGITYDSNNGLLYVAYGNGSVTAYNTLGVQQTLTGSFPGLDEPTGIAYDSNNGFLYASARRYDCSALA